MSSLYGIPESVSLGNTMNMSVLNENRFIRQKNADRMTKHFKDISSKRNLYKGQIKQEDLLGDVKAGVESSGITAIPKAIKKFRAGGVGQASSDLFPKSAPEGEPIKSGSIKLAPPKFNEPDISAPSPFSKQIVAPVEKVLQIEPGADKMYHDVSAVTRPMETGFRPIESSQELNPMRKIPVPKSMASMVNLNPMRKVPQAVPTLKSDSTIASAGADLFPKDVGDGSKVIKTAGGVIDTIGKVGAGLAIAGGVFDIGKDIQSKAEGKSWIAGANTEEQAGNVLGALAGGVETAGLSMDLTGALAPVGLALNVVGAGLGIASGIEDWLGEKKEEDKPKQALKQLGTEPLPKSTPLEKISSLSQAGLIPTVAQSSKIVGSGTY